MLYAILLVLGIQATPPAIVPVIEPDLKSAVYPVDIEQMYVAAARAAASKWSVTFVSKELWTITFETDRSYWNNRALRVSVVLTKVSDAKTKVQLTTQKTQTHGLAFTADGGLKKDYWKELTAQLNKKSSSTPTPTTSPLGTGTKTLTGWTSTGPGHPPVGS